MNIQTSRLQLRTLQEADRDFLTRLWTDPHITAFMGGPRTQNQMSQAIDEDLANPENDQWNLWVLVDKAGHHPVGHCGLIEKTVKDEGAIEVVYVIDQTFWGRGYATEIARALLQFAFGERHLNQVIALIKPDNLGSEKVAGKIGMSFRENLLRNGSTMMLYAADREPWIPGLASR